MAELFGFKITRVNDKSGNSDTLTVPTADDGTTEIAGGGHYASVLDLDGKTKSEADLIRRYRDIAQQPECDSAVEDIVNEAIVSDERDQSIQVVLERLPFKETVKTKIREEFNEVLRLLDFDTKGHDIFRRWYIDGRIYYQKIIDKSNPKLGITELRYIDSNKIRKVREVNRDRDKSTGVDIVKNVNDYYIYNERGLGPGTSQGVRITSDSIAYCASGLIDQNSGKVLSHLHKAIKPVNQLRMIEDSLVIYRISRAPERRIFYIDVGNLPKAKAEQYLADVMNKYRNKLVYNADTGEIKDDRRHMSMLEDYWLPRREGGRGTEISTLPGGQNLGDVEDIEYFKKKLYRSLNVPHSRMESDNGFNMGRASEISRDELKFNKFTKRLQMKFARCFTDLLRTQLVLKNIVSSEEFDKVKDFIHYDFATDNHFTELKEGEIMRERLDLLGQMSEYVGKYYSNEYIRKAVLRQTDADIEKMDSQIEAEGGSEGEEDDLDF